jgi:hypothetical protein
MMGVGRRAAGHKQENWETSGFQTGRELKCSLGRRARADQLTLRFVWLSGNKTGRDRPGAVRFTLAPNGNKCKSCDVFCNIFGPQIGMMGIGRRAAGHKQENWETSGFQTCRELNVCSVGAHTLSSVP